MTHIPVEKGVVDLILDAMIDLLTLRLQSEIPEDDVSRAIVIKAGPRQADPESVTVLIHENDPDNPSRWPHKPIKYRVGESAKYGIASTDSANPYDDPRRLGAGMELVGGGSQFTRAFTVEIEVFGRFMTGVDIGREETRRVASVVENRAVKALLSAGHPIGTGAMVTGDFGESVVMGPFMATSIAEQEEGEALIVRKFVRLWYRTVRSWDTDDW